jgi:glycine cleavage system H protein
MKYTETHEWIHLEGQVGIIGITEHAQKQLGDIVFVELPKIGRTVKAGEEIAVLESTKAAADVYTPVSGTILEVNESLKEIPEKINQDPEKAGWIYKIQLSDVNEVEKLLDFSAYELIAK